MDATGTNPGRAAGIGDGVLELGGRTFVVPPRPGPDDVSVYAEFRRQCMASARDPLATVNERIASAERAGKPFSPTVVKQLVETALSAANREEGKSEPTDAEIAARVHTLAGSQYVIWYRLRKADPTLTLEWVHSAVPDMATRDVVFARFVQLDGLSALDPKKASSTG